MANDEIIARRYAKGLAEAAREANRIPETRDELAVLSDLLDESRGRHASEMLRFLSSPAVPPAEKAAAAGRILEKAGVHKMVSDFLAVLVDHGRVALAPRIARAFAEISSGMTGELAAIVRTARPLSREQTQRLREALALALGANVILHEEVEPALLAGARVTVGDKTFDGTVLGRLETLRHRLAGGT